MSKEKEFKTRNWFITINQNAECYDKTLEIVKGTPNLNYGCVCHDRDNTEQPHYHVCLMFENARTFKAIQKKFPGAHIEVMESKYLSFRYLTHKDNPEKFQYSRDSVIDNNNCYEYYSTHDEHIKLDEFNLFQEIENGNINNITDCVKIFGLKQTNLFRNTILKVLEEKIVKSKEIKLLEYENIKLRELNESINSVKQDYLIENLKLDNELTLAKIKIRELENIVSQYKERGLF